MTQRLTPTSAPFASDLAVYAPTDGLKATFHASGQYKLDGNIGLKNNTFDRITVTGPRPADIDTPTRLAEITAACWTHPGDEKAG